MKQQSFKENVSKVNKTNKLSKKKTKDYPAFMFLVNFSFKILFTNTVFPIK